MDKITHGALSCIPGFILDDRNGYALARAIDSLVTKLCRDVEFADALIVDPLQMPEWALDEYAYGNGITWYDKKADVEVKRRWVLDAQKMRYCVGTKDAVRHLMLGFYEYCAVEEWFEYGGKPYEFRIVVSGDTSEELEAWAIKAINDVKNLRSVFFSFAHGHRERITVSTRDTFYLTAYESCGDLTCGTFPFDTTLAFYKKEGLSLDTQSSMLESVYSMPTADGHDAALHADDVQEGQYEALALDARTRSALGFVIYEAAGEADVGTDNGSMHAGDQWTMGENEFIVCGDDGAL